MKKKSYVLTVLRSYGLTVLPPMIFLLFLQFISMSSMAQVTLKGKQFYADGNKFYPVQVCYCVHWVMHNGNYFLSPDLNYNIHKSSFECSDSPTCFDQLQTDFHQIADMGFNSVRITAIEPRYMLRKRSLAIEYYRKNNIHIGRDTLLVNPFDNSDFGMNLILQSFDKILEAASATSPPLKVMFISSYLTQNYDKNDYEEINLTNAFLDRLSSHLCNTPHINALFSYQVLSEPGHILYPKINNMAKQDACEIIAGWYDIIKANAPHHLVNVGNYGIGDVFVFDPSILKIDFNSIHYYPEYKPFEKADPLLQEKMRTRTANYLYWINQASIVPWIVDETGFSATANQGIPQGLDGTLADQEDYVAYSLDASCHCGASGFSLWQYQDIYWSKDTGTSLWRENYFGMLNQSKAPGDPDAEKPAVNIIRNYVTPPQITAPCLVDRTDIFDANRLYYNPFGYPRSPGKEIERTVVDQDGNFIKDAVVYVWTDMGKDTIKIFHNGAYIKDTIILRTDLYHTYTDANGKFIAIPPPRYGFVGTPQVNYPGIAMIKVSAAGADVFNEHGQGWCPGCFVIPSTVVLNKIKDDVVVSSETVLNGQYKTYKGRKSLTVSNTTVNSGGNATFTSAKSITLLPGFIAQAGSNVKMYIAPYDCSEWDIFNSKSILLVPKNDLSEIDDISKSKTIQLSFEKDFVENYLSVFPNPANSTVTIQLHSNNNESLLTNIKLYDVFGRPILFDSVKESVYILNVSHFPKGLYFIEVRDETKTYHQKLIIN